MAKPQSDGGGFIQIPNELYQAMYSVDLSASELRILLFILYQTVGYNHKSRKLSVIYISNGTQISAETVRKSLKKLIERNIISASSDYPNAPKTLSINKKFKAWHTVENDRTMRSKMTGQNIPHDTVENDRTMRYKSTPNTIQKKQYRKDNTESSSLPPTLDDVRAYCEERNYTFDPEKFFCSYEATGWKSRGSKITNWKALADVWQMTERSDPDDDPTLDSWGNPIKSDERE